MARIFLGMLLSAVAIVPAGAAVQHQHEGTAKPAIAAEAQATFERGLQLLHNFEYDRAADVFRKVQRSEPASVMAYWGEAMTYNHPLWAQQDAAAARAVLIRLGADPAARRSKARSPREAQWLDAIEALYGSGTKVERDFAYHAKMKAMFEADPADIDARAFYALSTLGLAHGGRDTALYMRAAALLEEVYPQHPDHPGVLHYLIHSYDDPDHAPLGARAAARYAVVAPDAGHAQHMVSHIFLPLGDWPRVEQANAQAMRVVNAQRAAEGRPPSSCGHYVEWQVYALQQQGRDSSAMIDACGKEAMAHMAGSSDTSVLGGGGLFNTWAVMAVRAGVDGGRWPDVTPPQGDRSVLGRFTLTYGKLLAARRDPVAAAAALEALKRDRAIIAKAMAAERPDDHDSEPWLDRTIAQGEAVVALARGERDRGIALLRAAAEAEAALPPPFGPPVLAKPSYELLGDELLALGRTAEAAAAYQRALAAAPGRRLSLAGLAKATA